MEEETASASGAKRPRAAYERPVTSGTTADAEAEAGRVVAEAGRVVAEAATARQPPSKRPAVEAGTDIMAPATIKVRWALPGGGSVKVEIAADADIDDLKQRIMAAAGIPSTLASLTDLHIGAERGINHWTATAQVLRNEASIFLPHGTVVVPVVRSLAAQTIAGVAGAYFADGAATGDAAAAGGAAAALGASAAAAHGSAAAPGVLPARSGTGTMSGTAVMSGVRASMDDELRRVSDAFAKAAVGRAETGRLRADERDDSAASSAGAGDVGSSGVELDAELPFVNRYAEAIDVLLPNLINQLTSDRDAKPVTPLAGQPVGTGKTVLGRHLTEVLRRPRETDATLIKDIAGRLKNAWSLAGAPNFVDKAQADPRDENLVVRTLIAAVGSGHAETVLKLKTAPTLVIPMKTLPRPPLNQQAFSFAYALAYGIYREAATFAGVAALTHVEFRRHDGPDTRAIVELLISAVNGPVLLVLDDINDLGDATFAQYFGFHPEGALYAAMKVLNLQLQELHGLKNCFVYCTGKSLWLSTLAMASPTSPLIVEPTLLQPLSTGDIIELLQRPMGSAGSALMDKVGVAPQLLELFAERVQRATGGVGRMLQYALRALRRQFTGSGKLLLSPDDIERSLVRAQATVCASLGPNLAGMRWDGRGASANLGHDLDRPRLLQLFARLLLLDAAFSSSLELLQGSVRVSVLDVAAALGLSYAPVASSTTTGSATAGAAAAAAAASCAAGAASGANDGMDGSGADDLLETAAAMSSGAADLASPILTARRRVAAPTHVRLVAGEWFIASMLADVGVSTPASVQSTLQFLAIMQSFGGTMRGRPFEMLCADALCFRSTVSPSRPLRELLPHLGSCAAADCKVPALRIVALPKVTAKVKDRLADVQKESIMRSPGKWVGPTQVHPEDLAWILAVWLQDGVLAIPADAQSASQEAFLKLGGRIIGIAFKAVSASNPTQWSDVRDEISKAPKLEAYTLALWSLQLAPELQSAIGVHASDIFRAGAWMYAGGTVTCAAAANLSGKLVFDVPAGMEVVVANPQSRTGGLRELLGPDTWDVLCRISRSSPAGELDIIALEEWMVRCMPADGVLPAAAAAAVVGTAASGSSA